MVCLAQQDGYTRLPEWVYQHRVRFDNASQFFCVTDSLLCSDRQEVEIHWHCSEHSTVRLEYKLVRIETGDVIVEMSMPGLSWQVEVIEGQQEPPLGWISRRFDTKVQSPTIRWRGALEGTTHLKTLIKISRTKD